MVTRAIGASGAKARTLRVHIVGEAKGLKRTLDKSEREVEGFGARIRRRGVALAKMLGAAALAGGVAVAAGVVASVKAYASFDDAMTKSLAIMGDVSAAMRGKLSDAAREVGKTTSFSATEAADAYFFLASAGLSAEQQLAAMPRVAKFAQAGNFDLARATDLATDAQSALGMASDDASENLDNLTRVTDVLIKANQNANASAEQFSEALTEKAGAALRSVNKDIEEGAAVLSVFADQGIKGTNAGTTLTATLDGLTRNARDNADAFADLGVDVFDSNGEMNNMADIVGQLEGGLAGMSTEQREATLASLGFTRQARNGILALIGNSEALAEYEASLRDAGGAVDEVADKQLQSFSAQLGLLKDRLVDIGIEIGSRVTPHLQRAAEWLNANGDEITDKVVGALDDLVGWWDRNGSTIVDRATATKDAITEFAGDVAEGWRIVREKTGPAVSWLGDQLDSVGQWFGITRDTVADEVEEMSNEAVGAVVGMVTGMTDQARMMARDGEVLSGELADAWIGNVERIRDDTVAAITTQRDELGAIAQGLYEDLDSVTAEQAGAVIKNANDQADESIAAAQRQAELVTNQIQSARDRGVEISEEQAERIVGAMERQRDGAVTALADQAHQSEVILARLAAETGKISLETASAALVESARQRQGTVEAAEAEYQERVSAIIRLRDESDEFTAQMATDAIAEAQRMRDSTINAANVQHAGVVFEIEGMRHGVVNETNLMTGEVLSGWDRFVANVLVPVNAYGSIVWFVTRKTWGDVITRSKTGWEELREGWSTWSSTVKGLVADWRLTVIREAGFAMAGMRTTVGEQGALLVGWFRNLPGRIVGALGDLGGALVSKGKQLIGGFVRGIRDSIPGIGDAVGDAVGAAGTARASVAGTASRGPGGGGSAMAKARAAMAGLPLRFSSTYRTPAQNRRAGGSPTSHHMDRANPAVDIVGPTWALDAVAAKLRATPHRELLWRVPNHAPGDNPHVHYAHRGGRVTADGIVPLRPDELDTRLKVGETVLPKGAPRGGDGGDIAGLLREQTTVMREQNKLLGQLLAAAATPGVLQVNGRELARVTAGDYREELRVEEEAWQ